MSTVNFNTTGERISDSLTNSPSLNITWGKAFGDVYCHHASLFIPTFVESLFTPEIVKVSVRIRLNTIEKGEVKSFSDKTISRFLPVKFENQSMLIPLNSTEILECLCENGWTTLKGGKRGAPKSFPLSISVSSEGINPMDYSFLSDKGQFPFTICEGVFDALNDSDKVDTKIILQ